MPEEWIVRVHGKEYGPVDVEELRDWRADGRLIGENEVRAAGDDRWFPAGDLVEVFGEMPPPVPVPLATPPSLGSTLARTWGIYRARFGQFLGLTALVVVPSICAQLSSAAGATDTLDLRTALAGMFNLITLVASLVAWPIYVAGIQILTQETAAGRTITFAELVAQALRFWWRVAFLCLLVYGAFFLLILLALAILAMIAGGPPTLLITFVALVLLIFQVWMFSRVFMNVLFWQQTAVLEDAPATQALRRSREIAHSRRDLRWWQRPQGRGTILASLWCLIAAGLSLGPEWSTVSHYFDAIRSMQDAQSILQSLTASAKNTGFAVWPLVLAIVEAVLRPLLGIAFVLVYLERGEAADRGADSLGESSR